MGLNPRVKAAFAVMRELGISEDIGKPVLKRLLKLYNKNWVLIEEDNYRVLVDAIFEEEDSKGGDLGEDSQMHEEPEHPLKRLRLRNQEGRVSTCPSSSSLRLTEIPLKRPKVEDDVLPETCSGQQSVDAMGSPQTKVGNTRAGTSHVSPRLYIRDQGKQPVSPKSMSLMERTDPSRLCDTERTKACATKSNESDSLSFQIRLIDKQKEAFSPQVISGQKRSISERSSLAVCFKEPNVDPGIVLLPKQKVSETQELIKPKDEPLIYDLPQCTPAKIICPDKLCNGDSAIRNHSVVKPVGQEIPASHCVDGESERDGVLPCSSERTNSESANVPKESPPELEIASSPLGEVKMSLSCNSALRRPDFHTPSLDAVLKSIEDKCFQSYKISDPKFSVTKLLTDMCQCFLEKGIESCEKAQGRSTNATPTL